MYDYYCSVNWIFCGDSVSNWRGFCVMMHVVLSLKCCLFISRDSQEELGKLTAELKAQIKNRDKARLVLCYYNYDTCNL